MNRSNPIEPMHGRTIVGSVPRLLKLAERMSADAAKLHAAGT
jgi:hypothetical protein